jgi:hypothetical protein
MTMASTLVWRSTLDGRLLLAAANKGFYEVRMGDRVLYTSFAGGMLLVTDLGPCHQARLEECKDLCERHSAESSTS